MAITTARTMPGVMELLPLDQITFQRMLDTIRSNFERFGFLPIETPVMELAEVLLTKTGGETERQVYFVQSTGSMKQGDQPELALRFDLTVPLARYVAQHERELSFPFRRYQIQRVYRGESAQRGRFREFYQCDIDVVGKDALSLRYDAELPAVIQQVFQGLNIGPFTIHLNNRKIMRGFFESIGIADAERQGQILREIDKLDKRGAGYIYETLVGQSFGLSEKLAKKILEVVQIRSNLGGRDAAFQKIRSIADDLGKSTALLDEGVREMDEVMSTLAGLVAPPSHSCFALNLSIARGLDYYTGTVYETTLNDHPQVGSICSGGRYESLAAHYTKSKLPGVGISIGATRLFWQLREANLLAQAQSTVKVLITQMDPEQMNECLKLASEVRAAGINAELVMESAKLAKQFKYADRLGIRFVMVLDEGGATVTIKDMASQQQSQFERAGVVQALSGLLSKEPK